MRENHLKIRLVVGFCNRDIRARVQGNFSQIFQCRHAGFAPICDDQGIWTKAQSKQGIAQNYSKLENHFSWKASKERLLYIQYSSPE